MLSFVILGNFLFPSFFFFNPTTFLCTIVRVLLMRSFSDSVCSINLITDFTGHLFWTPLCPLANDPIRSNATAFRNSVDCLDLYGSLESSLLTFFSCSLCNYRKSSINKLCICEIFSCNILSWNEITLLSFFIFKLYSLILKSMCAWYWFNMLLLRYKIRVGYLFVTY